MLRIVGRGDDRKIDKTLAHPVENVVAAAVPQAVPDLRELLLEAGQPARGQKGRTPLDDAEIYRSAHSALKAHDLVLSLFGHVQYLRCTQQQKPAGVGQLKLPLAAYEQRRAELVLERLYLIAQRRLTHAQPLGCVGNVQLLGDDSEVSECSKIHLHTSHKTDRGYYTIFFGYGNRNAICILFINLLVLIYRHKVEARNSSNLERALFVVIICSLICKTEVCRIPLCGRV